MSDYNEGHVSEGYHFSIYTAGGMQVELEYRMELTFGEMKEEVGRVLGCPPRIQMYSVNGMSPKDTQTLSDLGLSPNCKVQMLLYNPDLFIVFVEYRSRIYSLDVLPSDSIDLLMKSLSKQLNQRLYYYSLKFHSRVIRDKTTTMERLGVVIRDGWFETARRVVNKNAAGISDIDQARLLALQLQVTYGKFLPSREVPEFKHKPAAYRRRREETWKALGALSRQRAMEKYLELARTLLPNWDKDVDFTDLEISPSGSIPESQIVSLDLSQGPFQDVGTQSNIAKPPSRMFHFATSRPAAISLPHSRSKGAIEELQNYDFKRIVTSLPKLNRISANYDAAETIRRIQMRNISPPEEGKRPVESKYYRKMNKQETPSEPQAEQVKAVLGGFLETLQSGVNFGGENALWSDQSKDVLNRLEATFSSLSKGTAGPVRPTLETQARRVPQIFKPRFAAVEATLAECHKLMSESSEPCAAHLLLIKQDFSLAVTYLLDYIDEINDKRAEQERELEGLRKIHEDEHKALSWLREMYHASDPKYGLASLRAEKKSRMELMVAETYSRLPGECMMDLRKMEDNLKVATGIIAEIYGKLIYTENERDKLQDEIAMVQMSAYQENILLSNIYKDLKKSVGIIQGSEGRGLPNEVQLKKELDELKSENLVLRKDNEGLRERLRDARRRNSVAMDET